MSLLGKKMKTRTTVTTSVCSLFALLLLSRACSSTELTQTSPSAGDGGDASPNSDQGTPSAREVTFDSRQNEERDTRQSDSGSCVPPGGPADLPVGWEPHTDWSCKCGFFVPGPKGEMPKPFEWESCPPTAPTGFSCRKLKPFWTKGMGRSIADESFLFDDPKTGKKLLGAHRLFVDGQIDRRMVVVQDLEGSVRYAFMQIAPPLGGCVLLFDDANDGHIGFRVEGDNALASLDMKKQAIIGGDVDSRHSPVVFRYEFKQNSPLGMHSWVSRKWVIRYTPTGSLVVTDWSFTQTRAIYDPSDDPEGMPAFDVLMRGTGAFFTLDARGNVYVMSWDPSNGTRPLLRWYGDSTRSAGNFATDGKDMVWTYAEGRGAQSEAFKTYLVMAAPFETDPSLVAKTARPLRKDPDHDFMPQAAYKVGCGYAAHVIGQSNHVLVLRLSDGASWTIPGWQPPERYDWAWRSVIGVTCEEVFVYVQESSQPEQNTIARIRFDSLGEPTPSDL